MKANTRHSGLSLVEEVVVIAAIALLVIFGLPAVRTLFRSIQSRGAGKAMISTALSSARAIAAKEQHYAGIRFQHAYYKDDPAKSPLKMPQYMIFIVYDFDKTGLENGFRAVDGLKPIKLPDDVGVMEVVADNLEINDDSKLVDKTTFSIIFSPSGKLIIHDVQTRNRDGKTNDSSKDDIFNTQTNVGNGIGMFLQDDYPSDGLDTELSKKRFIIYDRDIFKKTNTAKRYDDYLKNLEKIYINPYTGTMIDK